MTEEQLQQIRNHLALVADDGPATDTPTEQRLTGYVRDLLTEVEAMRPIVAKVAAIRETGAGDPNQPYDAHISAWTIHQARTILAG